MRMLQRATANNSEILSDETVGCEDANAAVLILVSSVDITCFLFKSVANAFVKFLSLTY